MASLNMRCTYRSCSRYFFEVTCVTVMAWLLLFGYLLRQPQFICELNVYNEAEAAEVREWHSGCPRAGDGARGVVLTVVAGGRLGNHVWEYLSVWAVARRYGAWPAVPRTILNTLLPIFPSLSVPALEDLAARCDLPHLLSEFKTFEKVGNENLTLEAIRTFNSDKVILIVLSKWKIDHEHTIPVWSDLGRQMIFNPNLEEHSQKSLREVRSEMAERAKRRGEDTTSQLSDLEYVAVHVRRTDYLDYISRKFAAEPADEKFYLQAIALVRARLAGRRVVFVVVSDDPAWCRAKLQGADVVVAGTGDVAKPARDLALLAACNHTIFAYGTFALTAAMHNAGGVTVTFDLKKSASKNAAMTFGEKLKWNIL